jgi:hypothetical protein
MTDQIEDPVREARSIAALADPAAWASAAADLLADLGFTLINSHHPAAPGGSHLLVALRDAPTLRHFDPESLLVYTPAGADPGDLLIFDRATLHGPARRRVLWGHVHVVDRLRVENRFLSFGGELRSAVVDSGLTVVDVSSPGPIVRWGGHSQGSDPLAAEIGAYFGRLILAVDYQPGVEARLADLPPVTMYAAFLTDADRRLQRIARRTSLEPELRHWIEAEVTRLRRAGPVVLSEAAALLDDLRLPGIAAGPVSSS